ncbi:MAG: EpsG family protein [Eubacteriales bacterium]|nr:EpsG family protein [Eubacteriales bacterium]
MIVYYGVIIAVLVFGTSAQFVNSRAIPTERVSSDGTIRYKNHYGIFYPILVFIFIFVGGFRYYVGTDFGGYYKLYNYKWNDVLESIKALDEPGLKLVSFIARYVWDDGVSVILLSCIITTALVFYGISKFDNNDITIMLLIYVLIAGWTFSFNGVRQAMAASIIFAFARVNKNNWILKYVLICFIAFLFHKSALMMIPVLLLSHRKLNKSQVLLLVISAVLIPLFFDFAFDFMGADTTNEDALEYIDRQINPIRVVVSFAPAILLIFVEDKKRFFEDNGFALNLMLFNAILTLTTMNSAYLNRFTQYTSMFLIIYYPATLKALSKNMRLIATFAVILLYFLYFRYELTNGVDEVVWNWSFSHFGEA